MGYTLEQFSAECHQILKQDPGVEGRKQVCALVQQVLKDDDFIKTHLGDDARRAEVRHEQRDIPAELGTQQIETGFTSG